IGKESAVPIVLAVDFNRWKAGRQRTARHNMLGADNDMRTVEIGKLPGPHIDRTNAQAHVLGIVDAVEINQPLQRLLEGRRVVVTDEFIRRKPVLQCAWGETSGPDA